MRLYLSQHPASLGNGAQGRDRTTATANFSRMLYQLSYLGIAPGTKSKGSAPVYREAGASCPAAPARFYAFQPIPCEARYRKRIKRIEAGPARAAAAALHRRPPLCQPPELRRIRTASG